MSEDRTTLIMKSFEEGRDKMIYFLLAAAGAAIGFAITQTRTTDLSWSNIPVGLAVLCWAISFFAGCRHIYHVNSVKYHNYQILRIEVRHPNPNAADREKINEARAKLEKLADTAGNWGPWQFWPLIVGAALYVSWHLLEMYLRTPK